VKAAAADVDNRGMVFDPQSGRFDVDGADKGKDKVADRRSSGRVLQDTVHCNLGAVVDLSVRGMQILTPDPPPKSCTVILKGLDMRLKLRGRVAWVKARGFFRAKQVGIEFVDVPEDAAQALTRLALSGRSQRSM